MKLARVFLGLALIGGASYGAYLVISKASKAPATKLQNLQKGIYIPDGADPSIAPVKVGYASGYASVSYQDTGTIDTSHLQEGWAYVPIVKDWL